MAGLYCRSGAALRGIQGIHWINIFLQKNSYIFLTLENKFSNKKTSLQEMPGLMKRPFYDVGNDAQTIFTILFVSKKVDNRSLIH